MQCRNARVVFVAAVLSAAATAQNAQNATPEIVIVRVVQIKSDMVNDWRDTYKNEVLPAYKKAGIPSVMVSQTVFGAGNEYAVIMPLAKFAQMDGDSPMIRALGRENAMRLTAKLVKYTEKSMLLAVRYREDLSIMHPGAPQPYAVVTHLSGAPARGGEIESWIKNDYGPAMRKAEVENLFIYQALFGGELPHWVTVAPRNDMAALDQPPELMRSLGEEGVQKLLRKLDGVVTHVERYVIRTIPELSYFQEQRAAN